MLFHLFHYILVHFFIRSLLYWSPLFCPTMAKLTTAKSNVCTVCINLEVCRWQLQHLLSVLSPLITFTCRWQLHYVLTPQKYILTYILCCWKLHYLASVPHTPMYICRWQLYHLVSVPLTPLSTFMGRWIFGEVLCKIFPWSQVKTNSNFQGRTTQGVREGLIKSGTNKKRERRRKGEREKVDLLHIEKNIYKWENTYMAFINVHLFFHVNKMQYHGLSGLLTNIFLFFSRANNVKKIAVFSRQ